MAGAILCAHTAIPADLDSSQRNEQNPALSLVAAPAPSSGQLSVAAAYTPELVELIEAHIARIPDVG